MTDVTSTELVKESSSLADIASPRRGRRTCPRPGRHSLCRRGQLTVEGVEDDVSDGLQACVVYLPDKGYLPVQAPPQEGKSAFTKSWSRRRVFHRSAY